MATLYELTEQLRNFELKIDEETGEILNFDELEEIELERDSKIENIALWIKNLKADAEAYKAEKEAFAKKQQYATNKAERLKEFLEYYLNGEKFKSRRVEITYRKSESVEVENISDLPDGFLIIDYKPNKTEIKRAIKDGEAIKGAHLIEKMNMQIK